MKLEFIPLDYDNFDFEGRNYARIIGRDDKGKRVCVVDSCDIYLWAILKDGVSEKQITKLREKIEKIQLDVKGRKTRVEKTELHDKNFLGKKVKAIKIFATNYKDLHDIADQIDAPEVEKRRGYDLGFVTHYIIERKLNPLSWNEISGDLINGDELGGVANSIDSGICIKANTITPLKKEGFTPKVLAYDIETDEFKIGEGEIVMISLVSDNFKKVLTWKEDKDNLPFVEVLKDESEMIEKFCEYVKEISPDFLVGYFSDGFDLPYLRARAEKLRVKLNIGLDGSAPKFSRGAMVTGQIDGIVHIDLLRFIQTVYAQYLQSETLSLNEIAKEFLGDQKKEFKFQHSSKINDWKQYFEYNLHDSVLTYKLFEKFWPDFIEFTKVTKEPVFDVSRFGLSKHVESYILHNLDKFNEIPEKRPTYDEISGRKQSGGVEGAFVFDPKPGLYENIAIFDFTSMHTSIIITHNISKGTLLEKKSKEAYESPELELDGGKRRFYFSKEKSFFPELLREIFELRKKYKAEYKKDANPFTKARSNAFKVLSASVHGYIGFFGARYYSIESSASILAFVRKFNQETIAKIQEEGYQPIYGDTDSIAFLIGKSSKVEIKKLLEKLNSELPGIMELELEDFYKRGIWVTKRTGEFGAKKKYALITEEGKLKIRGFETVRRDWCPLARETQNKVLKMILEDGDEKRAIGHIKKIVKELKERKIKKEEIMIRTKLTKPLSEYKSITPHVIAARRMEEQQIPIDDGSMIEYYISETQEKKKLVRDKVKLAIEEGDYDIEYYLNHQILPALENIFQVFSINIHEILNGKKQMTLGEF